MAITKIPYVLSNGFDSSLGSTGKFNTVSAATSFTPLVAPAYIETAGYSSVGDGGGALYKLVASEPTHTAKFSITLSDGVTVKWYELAEQPTNTKMFTDIPTAATYLKTKGGELRVPRGVHTVSSQILLDYTTQTGDVNVEQKGVYLKGDGLHNTLLNNTTVSHAISILGDDGAFSGWGAIIYAGVENLSITGTGPGIKMKEAAFTTLRNIMFRSVDVGMDLESVLSCSFERLMFTAGINGVQIFKGSGFSDHNANKWTDCEFRLGSGVAFSGGPSSGLWFENLTIQGWGTHANLATGGMDLTFTGAEGGVGLKIDGGYFEANGGGADIRLTNNGPNTVVHTITGVNFTRLGTLKFVNNNIIASGASPQIIVLEGCSFGGRGGYVPNAGRLYVNAGANVTVVCRGCQFDSAVEQGSLVNS